MKMVIASLVLILVMEMLDGPFVYTGFKPAFVIIKRKDAVTDWLLHDNKRMDIILIIIIVQQFK
jgi:hypothetical protein